MLIRADQNNVNCHVTQLLSNQQPEHILMWGEQIYFDPFHLSLPNRCLLVCKFMLIMPVNRRIQTESSVVFQSETEDSILYALGQYVEHNRALLSRSTSVLCLRVYNIIK